MQGESSEDKSLALLVMLAQEDGMSLSKARKRLDLSMSELLRLLVALGPHAELGGLGLVEHRRGAGRDSLHLTDKGYGLCKMK